MLCLPTSIACTGVVPVLKSAKMQFDLIFVALFIFAVLPNGQKCQELRDLCSYSKSERKCVCEYVPHSSGVFPVLVADCARLNFTVFPSDSQFISDVHDLDLSHNSITSLYEAQSAFSSESLKRLDLSYNKLSYISDEFLRNIPNLEFLDLSRNALTSLENENVFLGIRNLLELDISYNSIASLPVDVFATLPQLKFLNLGYNDMGSFLAGFSNMINASLGLNPDLVGLKMDSLGLNELHNAYFDGFHNLQYLSLADNNFQEVPVVPYTVTYLDLSGTQITTLAARHLNYHALKTFKLNRLAKLSTIDKYAFYNLQSLETLSLNDCGKLKEFSDVIFGVISKDVELPLKKISIARSGLQSINYTYGYLFDDMEHVDLGNNPWRCDCNLMWLREYNTSLYRPENIR